MKVLKSKNFLVAVLVGTLGGVILLQTSVSAIAAAPAAELTTGTKMVKNTRDERSETRDFAAKLVADRNFDELERSSIRMRENDERTNEGWSKLACLYDGIDMALKALAKSGGNEAANTFLAEWKNAKPESKTVLVAEGRNKITEAWKIRGNGMGDSVSADKWKLFRAKTAEASSILNQVRTAPGKYDPQAGVGLLQIGMANGMSREEKDDIVNECIERYPTYEAVYRAMAISLLHRWQGEEGDVEKFAADMQTRLPKPLGDLIYSRIFGAAWNYEGKAVFTEYHFSYDSILAGYNALFDQYSDTILSRQGLAYLATRFEDRETARKMLADTADYWHTANINGMWGIRLTFNQANAWAKDEGPNPLLPNPAVDQSKPESGITSTTATNISTSGTASL